MMIAPAGLATFVAGSINNFMHAYVVNTSTALSSAIAPVIGICVTIWITMYGMAVMRGEVSEPVNIFVKNMVKMNIILTIALSAGVYQSLIADGVIALQTGLVQIIAPSSAYDPTNPTSGIFQLIDQFIFDSDEWAWKMFTSGSFLTDPSNLAGALLVFLGSTVMAIIAIGFSVMATVGLYFVLGIGPLFIACLAFPATSKYFDGWLSKVLNYVFLVIGLGMVMTLSLSVTEYYITTIINAADPRPVQEACGLIVVEGCMIFLMWQMPQIASGLMGGASLTAGGFGGYLAGKTVGAFIQHAKGKDATPDPAPSPPPSPTPNPNENRIGSGQGNEGQSHQQALLDHLNNVKRP